MNKHLDNYLVKKYPKIFADRYKSMQETCMCWGFECGNGWFFLLDRLCTSIQSHIDNPRYVEPNTISLKLKKLWNELVWNPILYPLGHKYFNPQLDDKKGWERWSKFQDRWCFRWNYIPGPPIPQLVADQVKEKFGGLRFYYHGGDEYCGAIISFAESLSYDTCEICGRNDELVTTTGRGWTSTLCPCCRKKEDKDVHNKSLDKEMVKLWEKVRKDEAKRTPKTDIENAFKTLEEVRKYGKKKD